MPWDKSDHIEIISFCKWVCGVGVFHYNMTILTSPMEKSVTEKQQIKKLPTWKKKTIEALDVTKVLQVEGLINAIDAAWLQEFMEYIRSPWKMLWPNFVAWVARWFGALVWVTAVLALIWWMFAITIDLPLIGKRLEPYVLKIQMELNKYIDQTNYSDEFRWLDETLKQIEQNTKSKQL
jgi:hypothetical protein